MNALDNIANQSQGRHATIQALDAEPRTQPGRDPLKQPYPPQPRSPRSKKTLACSSRWREHEQSRAATKPSQTYSAPSTCRRTRPYTHRG